MRRSSLLLAVFVCASVPLVAPLSASAANPDDKPKAAPAAKDDAKPAASDAKDTKPDAKDAQPSATPHKATVLATRRGASSLI